MPLAVSKVLKSYAAEALTAFRNRVLCGNLSVDSVVFLQN